MSQTKGAFAFLSSSFFFKGSSLFKLLDVFFFLVHMQEISNRHMKHYKLANPGFINPFYLKHCLKGVYLSIYLAASTGADDC